MSSDLVRIAVIGAGMIGRCRIRALDRVPGARLVAVADVDEGRAHKALAGRDWVRVLSRGQEVAALDNVDAVVLCTPPSSHEALGMACLEAGKHLLCEKPLASTVGGAQNLVGAALDRGLCLATGYTLRQTPAARLARLLVDRGEIGELDHVCAFHGHGGGRDFGPTWITKADVAGGGTLMDNGIHMIDLVRWFLGDAVRSVGLATGHVWGYPGSDDNGFVLLENQAGRIGLVHSSWTEWAGYGYRVEVYGAEGCIRFGYSPLWLTVRRGSPGKTKSLRRHLFPVYQIQERLRGWQWSFEQTLVRDIEDWIDAIRSGREAPASGRDGLEGVRIALGVRRLRT